jgi:hypothetical protein
LKEQIHTIGFGSVSRLCALAVIALLPSGLSCSNRPSEIIVTTDSARTSTIPTEAIPVSAEPNLPSRNPDLEAAGDKIAEAIVYLNSRKKEHREVAHVLEQAGLLISHAEQNSEGEHRQKLHEINEYLDSISKGMHRSTADTSKQLALLNKQIDAFQDTVDSDNSAPSTP